MDKVMREVGTNKHDYGRCVKVILIHSSILLAG